MFGIGKARHFKFRVLIDAQDRVLVHVQYPKRDVFGVTWPL